MMKHKNDLIIEKVKNDINEVHKEIKKLNENYTLQLSKYLKKLASLKLIIDRYQTYNWEEELEKQTKEKSCFTRKK